MNIVKELNGDTLTLKVDGRLDTSTAPQLDEEVKAITDDIKNLVFDFKGLEYISSAGLRVLLSAQKMQSNKGKMVVKNINDDIKSIFDITGFLSILTIE